MTAASLTLVTGANGFVGSALCKELAKRGIPHRRVVRGAGMEGDFSLGSFDEKTDWADALHDCTTVIHLAARAHVLHEAASDSLEAFRKTNLHATVNLARSAARNGVRRFVYISSIGVNGICTSRDAAFTEEDIAHPHNEYAQSKWEAECALRAIETETGLEVVVVRPPLVYGANAPGNFALMVKALKRGLPLPFASVENLRSLIYVENLVDALILCARHSNAAGHTYVLADNEQISTANLLRELGNSMHMSARLFSCPPWLLRVLGTLTGRANTVDRLLDSLRIDSRKIQRELGWKPPFRLQEGVCITAKELLQKDEKNI